MPKFKNDEIQFKKLEEVNKEELMDLMNNPLVRRQLPLAKEAFDENAYKKFIRIKNNLWIEHGYGPWAFFINQKFAGWGGLQYEEGDPDLALILHPKYWGAGKSIYKKIIAKAFNEMGFESITALLPISRKHDKALLRLNFKPDGQTTLENELFIRFRLNAHYFSEKHLHRGGEC
ncbi:MAG: hypothetical protein S4CHLAM7_00080 [Chlamydiae bacterium]|nr:hypothetical protein [Chlamydiota bacterium]